MLRKSRVVSFAILATTALTTTAWSASAFAAEVDTITSEPAAPAAPVTDIIVTGTRASGQALPDERSSPRSARSIRSAVRSRPKIAAKLPNLGPWD